VIVIIIGYEDDDDHKYLFGGNRTTGKKIGCPSNGCSSSTDSTCGLVKKIFFFSRKKRH